MRPLPRLHAVTDSAVIARDDFAIRAAAIAAAGSVVAIHARDRSATAARLTALAERLLALARPAEAAVVVNARADIAAALDAQGVQLGTGDLSPSDIRRAFAPNWSGWIGASIHDLEAARVARDAGADYLMFGNLYETSSHPGRPAKGLPLLHEVALLGLPVIAIGGITSGNAPAVRDAGAYGVAAISALWKADDAGAASLALLAPWVDGP